MVGFVVNESIFQLKTRSIHFMFTSDPSFGGAATGVNQLIRELNKNGLLIDVFSCANPFFYNSEEINTGLQSTVYMGRWIFRNKYGLGGAWQFLRLLFSSADYGSVVIHQLYSLATMYGYLFSKYRKIPLRIMLHGSLNDYHESESSNLKNFAKKVFISQVLEYAEIFVVTSSYEKFQLPVVLQTKSVIIPFGKPTGAFPSKSDYIKRAGEEQFNLLFVGRFDRKKNLSLCLDALKVLQSHKMNFHFFIAGDGNGEIRNYLEAFLRQNSFTGKISLLGWIDQSKLWDVYRNSHLLLLPSFDENFGLVVLDALSCGLPTLTSQFVGVSSDFGAKVKCLEIDAISSDAIAEAIHNFRLIDPSTVYDIMKLQIETAPDWCQVSKIWSEL